MFSFPEPYSLGLWSVKMTTGKNCCVRCEWCFFCCCDMWFLIFRLFRHSENNQEILQKSHLVTKKQQNYIKLANDFHPTRKWRQNIASVVFSVFCWRRSLSKKRRKNEAQDHWSSSKKQKNKKNKNKKIIVLFEQNSTLSIHGHSRNLAIFETVSVVELKSHCASKNRCPADSRRGALVP